ncbi:MAG: alpha/beta fold hydrolase [Gemmataceae bacterium]|nr:alpha/beta fold hydrolase [Gemmataceae bacterium]
MSRWCGLLGLVLWLGGTATAVIATYEGIRSTPVDLRLEDGITIRGTLYRARSGPDPAPAAVVLHGTAVSHASCVPGLAIPLARIGFVVLAIDLRGHGRSGGTLPRSEYVNLETLLSTPADQPELDAAIAFLQAQPFVDRSRLALVGHSRGGWIVVDAGCRREDVACVVSVSSGPTVCTPQRPHNLLFLVGGLDEVIPARQYRSAFARATGAEVEPGVLLRDPELGTVRLMVVSPWSLHLSTLADPSMTRRLVQWAAWSVRRDPGRVPGDRLWITNLAVALASLGGLLAVTGILAALTRRLLPPPEATTRCRFRPAVAALLLTAPAVPFAAAWLGDHWPDGGVLFSSHAFALLLVAAAVTAVAGWAVPASGAKPRQAPLGSSLGRGALLGVLGGSLWLTLLGVPWGTTWLDLVPTPERLRVTLILMALFFPCSLFLVSGTQKVLGQPTAPAEAVLRGLVWLGLGLAVWLGHVGLVRPERPFLGIPTLFVAASSVVPLPLWLLPDRPGLGVARAISHALGAACFLGWHLPFVHAG